MKFDKRVLSMLLILFFLIISCKKDDITSQNEVYFPKVKAIISQNCLSCHSKTGTWQGRPTALDTDTEIAQVSSSIKASVADPVSPRNKRMPQGGQLSQNDVDIIVKWFNKGGKASD
ncbi:hypothetical protein [Emticicia sp. SJ17W-69]|uniref:hypothetical protein n=1 Tax=Emticicia sp. SJ17W-69 TaxID=3421657 RepID=UPI003EB97AF1